MMHNLFICIGYLRKEFLRLPGLLSLLTMSYYLFIREIGEFHTETTTLPTFVPRNLVTWMIYGPKAVVTS